MLARSIQAGLVLPRNDHLVQSGGRQIPLWPMVSLGAWELRGLGPWHGGGACRIDSAVVDELRRATFEGPKMLIGSVECRLVVSETNGIRWATLEGVPIPE